MRGFGRRNATSSASAPPSRRASAAACGPGCRVLFIEVGSKKSPSSCLLMFSICLQTEDEAAARQVSCEFSSIRPRGSPFRKRARPAADAYLATLPLPSSCPLSPGVSISPALPVSPPTGLLRAQLRSTGCFASSIISRLLSSSMEYAPLVACTSVRSPHAYHQATRGPFSGRPNGYLQETRGPFSGPFRGNFIRLIVAFHVCSDGPYHATHPLYHLPLRLSTISLACTYLPTCTPTRRAALPPSRLTSI